MGLGVGQAQRAAPRGADQQPALDAHVLPQLLHVGDATLRGVEAHVRRRVARQRGAAAAAALVEQDDPVTVRVEDLALTGTAARTWAAVHDQRGPASGVTA